MPDGLVAVLVTTRARFTPFFVHGVPVFTGPCMFWGLFRARGAIGRVDGVLFGPRGHVSLGASRNASAFWSLGDL